MALANRPQSTFSLDSCVIYIAALSPVNHFLQKIFKPVTITRNCCGASQHSDAPFRNHNYGQRVGRSPDRREWAERRMLPAAGLWWNQFSGGAVCSSHARNCWVPLF